MEKKDCLELIIKVIERICTNSFSGILIQENNTIFFKILQLLFFVGRKKMKLIKIIRRFLNKTKFKWLYVLSFVVGVISIITLSCIGQIDKAFRAFLLLQIEILGLYNLDILLYAFSIMENENAPRPFAMARQYKSYKWLHTCNILMFVVSIINMIHFSKINLFFIIGFALLGFFNFQRYDKIERKELQLDAIEKLRQLRNEVMTDFHERELKVKELRDNGLTSTTEFEEMIVSMADLKRLIQMIDRDIEKLEKEL